MNNPIYFLYDASGKLWGLKYTDGNVYYYARNAQGDIAKIVNSSGSVVVEYTYDAWGNLKYTSGSMAATLGVSNPYRYRGYRYDVETGLYYLQSRYYNPVWGRFVNADGILGDCCSIIAYNQFAYCSNNPINLADYNGESAEDVLKWGWTTGFAVSQLDSPVPGPADVIGLAIGVGATVVAVGILIPWDQIGNWVRPKVHTSSDSIAIARAQARVKARVEASKRNVYRFFEIWFDNIGVPILGKPLSVNGAISRVRKGRNVITYFGTDALYVANVVGIGKAVWHQKHGGLGYFNHYHINGYHNSAHIYYLIGR